MKKNATWNVYLRLIRGLWCRRTQVVPSHAVRATFSHVWVEGAVRLWLTITRIATLAPIHAPSNARLLPVLHRPAQRERPARARAPLSNHTAFSRAWVEGAAPHRTASHRSLPSPGPLPANTPASAPPSWQHEACPRSVPLIRLPTDVCSSLGPTSTNNTEPDPITLTASPPLDSFACVRRLAAHSQGV